MLFSVSMVDGDLFDKLAYIASKMKKSTKPFGGIQVSKSNKFYVGLTLLLFLMSVLSIKLVIAGDFFQLPPVTKGRVSFAFNASSWAECIPKPVNLTQVFRQKDSSKLCARAPHVRLGRN